MPAVTTDIREANMPDSPSDSAAQPPQVPPVSPPTSNMNHPVVADVRSLTSGSPIVNGVHNSPSGPTSPSNINNNNNSNQLPPACGARQLSKLKRFLTTLQQFGSDISPEIGERVRGLVMNLVNNTISIEEFHQQLQEATNFPLRPFVIPFLKANLPLLQHELLQCAQMAKQTPQQYLHQHEQILRDREGPGMDEDLRPMEVPESAKRKAHEEMSRPKENGNGDIAMGVDIIGKPLPKRQCLNNSREGESTSHEILDSRHNNDNEEWKNIDSLLSSNTRKFDHASAELLNSKHERDSDDWRHIHTMLQCIIGMVDKTKRAVSVLQQRSQQDREELIQWARKCSEEAEQEVKRRASDLMTATIKQTEERVTEVKRRAEEAVSDVKRQAVIELQKAVRAAEEKANEAVAAAHGKMDKAVLEARRSATDEALSVANHQSDSSESCWNCGRKATETCSGCNVARYCGSFCQHKDWENHHHVCGQSTQNMGAGGVDSDDPPQASSATTTSSSSTPLINTSAGSPPNAISRMTTPPTSSDPITSLSDYVMKTPST